MVRVRVRWNGYSPRSISIGRLWFGWPLFIIWVGPKWHLQYVSFYDKGVSVIRKTDKGVDYLL